MTLENEDIYGNEAPIHPKHDPKFQQRQTQREFRTDLAIDATK